MKIPNKPIPKDWGEKPKFKRPKPTNYPKSILITGFSDVIDVLYVGEEPLMEVCDIKETKP